MGYAAGTDGEHRSTGERLVQKRAVSAFADKRIFGENKMVVGIDNGDIGLFTCRQAAAGNAQNTGRVDAHQLDKAGLINHLVTNKGKAQGDSRFQADDTVGRQLKFTLLSSTE